MVLDIKPENNLSTRQKLFCEAYAQTHNATKSAIIAGYAKSSAHSIGYRLTKNDYIQKEISRVIAESTQTCLSLNQRQSILSEIANHKRPLTPADTVTPKDRILAIAELNKIDGSYAPTKHINYDSIRVNIVIDEPKTAVIDTQAYKELPGQSDSIMIDTPDNECSL